MKNSNLENYITLDKEDILLENLINEKNETILLFRKASHDISSGSTQINIKDMVRFLALKRYANYWNIPVFGTTGEDILEETQFLMWEQRNGQHCLLLPLVDGDVRCTLVGSLDGVRVVWEGELPGQSTDKPLLAVFATGEDPYELIHSTVRIVSERLMTFRLREEKILPKFVDHFGWCTWNSFGSRVTEQNVIDGLQSFQGKDAQPKFIILDDGWQHIYFDKSTGMNYLQSFNSDPVKFKDGLAPLIRQVKDEFGIEEFGVWHALEGYWGGVNPKGELAPDYDIVANQKTDPPKSGESVGQTYYLKALNPRDVHRFYNDYYYHLRKQGVDMVKVDNQSSLQDFTNGKFGRGSSMRRYQEALQGASQHCFQGNTIHCMSNGNDVAFNMNSASVWRNSDDYYPKKGVDIQQTHVFDNAINALFSSTFSLPDWDMFQSHGPCAEMHAVARAISGGPVYVTDLPGEQDFSILKKLVVDRSKVLRFDQPSKPSPGCIYVDGRIDAQTTKVWTNRGEIGVLGIFHCQHQGKDIDDDISVADIPCLAKDTYAVYLHDRKQLSIIDRNDTLKLNLPVAGWEIATYSPVDQGVAPLGLIDKYAGAAALYECGWLNEHTFKCSFRAGSVMGFYSKNRPKEVFLNNYQVKFDYDNSNGLLTIRSDHEKSCEIRLDY